MADKTILYIKGEKNTEVARREVRLGDILTLECQRKDLVNRLSQIRILRIPEQGPSRVVVSVLKIISCIQEVCPGLDIRNEEGRKDVEPLAESRTDRGDYIPGCGFFHYVL